MLATTQNIKVSKAEAGIVCPNCGKVHTFDEFATLSEECQLIFALTHEYKPDQKNVIEVTSSQKTYTCPVCGNDAHIVFDENGNLETFQNCKFCEALNKIALAE